MTTPHRPPQPLQVRERAACMCAVGQDCSTFAPGHALHLIQARLASSTPTEWVDAVVESVEPGAGVVVVRRLDDGAPFSVWTAADAASLPAAGTPVALHERYHVLAEGARWINVATL
jgi:hypothetical protein